MTGSMLPASPQTEQAREHRWSNEADWAPWDATDAAQILTRHCTRTECGITEVSHRDAPSPCDGYDDDEIVLTYQNDTVGTVIVAIGSRFDLRWTDYVANDWTEPFESLSAAVARLATLIYCLESDPERMFSTANPDQFAVTAAEFLHANTA